MVDRSLRSNHGWEEWESHLVLLKLGKTPDLPRTVDRLQITSGCRGTSCMFQVNKDSRAVFYSTFTNKVDESGPLNFFSSCVKGKVINGS